jgi:DNA invertase Pin-like site-specific DNA recombinase
MTDYGYARVSTRDQDPQLQINALEQAGCWPIVKEHASGVAKKRPVLDEVLAQLRPGDQLTVWKLDRLGRSITFLHRTIEDLIERGISFRSLTDPIDTTSPQGRLQLGILASFSAFERELIKERTLAGKARMKAEGRHTGGPALFGWQANHVTPNMAEVKVIEEVTDRVLAGEPLGRIVDDLNTRPEVPRPRRGGQWRVTSMRRVLENPRTAAIVNPSEPWDNTDLHGKLVRIINRNQGKGQGQGGGRPAEHLLSGILVCGREGRPAQLVYRCKKASGSGGRFNGCGSTVVSMARADAWAEEAFVAAVVSEDFAEALSRRQAELLAGDATAEELDAWRAEIADIEQVQPTRFYDDDMRRRHAQLRRLVDQATAQLMAQPDLQALLDLPHSEDQLRDAWQSWTIAERRAWLRRVLYAIVVKPATTRRGPATDVESRMDPAWKI